MNGQQTYTLPTIAKLLGARLHQVRYACREYSIEPTERVGLTGVYGEPELAAVKAALERIQRRAGR